MDVVTFIVGKVADYMVVPIGRQVGYLIFYNRNLKKLDDKIKDLNDARERIIHSVEVERRCGKKIETNVVNWLKKVEEIIENANRLQEESLHANVKCSNFILRQQLSKKATKITNVVEVQEKVKFDSIGYLPEIEDEVSETRDGENYESRELFKEKVKKALKDSNSSNIGVYGLCGVGKSTMVENVYHIAKQHKLFDVVVKTSVSNNPDIKKIQGEIAYVLGLQFDVEPISCRAQRLRQRIKMEKNMLIIIDDVCSKLDLKQVGIPSYNENNGRKVGNPSCNEHNGCKMGISSCNEYNGCKLLITSRNQDVLCQMDVPKDFTFRLEPLSAKEAWSLFQIKVGVVCKDVNLKDVPFQISQKCGGLPLNLVTVASALRYKSDVHSWKDALRQLQSYDFGDALTCSALELSYESLESEEMKETFLLFALMIGVDVEKFLNFVISLNIFKSINTIDDARHRIYKIIETLKENCLLLESSSKTSGGKIEMHDFVRDVAIRIARRDKHVFLRKSPDEAKWPTHDTLKRCSQIFLYGCHTHELPQTVDAPNLKLFFLNSRDRSIEIPETFFKGMTSLKVLSLTCFNFSSLPISFRSLTNLHTLILDFCILENTDAIEALKYTVKLLR
ncbi:putative disease resistance protein At3g15700 [Cicer arietinum]|uniref:CC-NBS-LRR disease resistance protein n=1 Tax=Cicer arietinum TaxID=3827 RepID=A0A067XTE4_CICAR|nr:probable disease resistance protein At4g27220 [Cicer arietinum]AGT75407.1 CC-NBS-LRR disease resistance protein [Cicer arietinum]